MRVTARNGEITLNEDPKGLGGSRNDKYSVVLHALNFWPSLNLNEGRHVR